MVERADNCTVTEVASIHPSRERPPIFLSSISFSLSITIVYDDCCVTYSDTSWKRLAAAARTGLKTMRRSPKNAGSFFYFRNFERSFVEKMERR